ncbi:hypothetical protein AB1Y20_017996 [Prymnesium parvum]|uniref:PHD and RING finger domain-containing protein 1 n=1 Tax=Prymnesium parvum TaxID=97485 RepID=A0AB34JM84_PRYPA
MAMYPTSYPHTTATRPDVPAERTSTTSTIHPLGTSGRANIYANQTSGLANVNLTSSCANGGRRPAGSPSPKACCSAPSAAPFDFDLFRHDPKAQSYSPDAFADLLEGIDFEEEWLPQSHNQTTPHAQASGHSAASSSSGGFRSPGRCSSHSCPSPAIAHKHGEAPSRAGLDEECSICFESELRERSTTGQLGELDCCTHLFCFSCIRRWCDECSKCPLCKREITRLSRTNGHVTLENVKVTAKEQQKPEMSEEELRRFEEEADEVYNCRVCFCGDDAETILLCDSCDSGYHMHCLSPPLRTVPEGDWYCPDCAPTVSLPSFTEVLARREALRRREQQRRRERREARRQPDEGGRRREHAPPPPPPPAAASGWRVQPHRQPGPPQSRFFAAASRGGAAGGSRLSARPFQPPRRTLPSSFAAAGASGGASRPSPSAEVVLVESDEGSPFQPPKRAQRRGRAEEGAQEAVEAKRARCSSRSATKNRVILSDSDSEDEEF